MKITKTKIYDLEESMVAAGYPMATDIEDCEIPSKIKNLGSCKSGTGHDSFLKGILVSFDITYSQYFSMQLQRYSFLDIISSQSKMHRIMKMDIAKQCNEYVTLKAIDNLNTCIAEYNEYPINEKFMKVISNVPMGLELTMRCTTNYLQLKTIYQQRKNHKLIDWYIFCNWILSLEKFKELCL